MLEVVRAHYFLKERTLTTTDFQMVGQIGMSLFSNLPNVPTLPNWTSLGAYLIFE